MPEPGAQSPHFFVQGRDGGGPGHGHFRPGVLGIAAHEERGQRGREVAKDRKAVEGQQEAQGPALARAGPG